MANKSLVYMKYLVSLIVSFFASVEISNAQSQLLENVKNNPEEVSFIAKNARGFILSNYSEDNFKFSFKKLFDTV